MTRARAGESREAMTAVSKRSVNLRFSIDVFPKLKKNPSKLEVAPPPKCLSGVGEWVDTP